MVRAVIMAVLSNEPRWVWRGEWKDVFFSFSFVVPLDIGLWRGAGGYSVIRRRTHKQVRGKDRGTNDEKGTRRVIMHARWGGGISVN